MRYLVLLLLSISLEASIDDYYDYLRPPSHSDYGTIGLVNMPSARTMPEGSLAFHWSRAQPYMRGSIVGYPFSWFEALYKYTDINDIPYSKYEDFSGGQSLKDKAFDVKFVLLKIIKYPFMFWFLSIGPYSTLYTFCIDIFKI